MNCKVVRFASWKAFSKDEYRNPIIVISEFGWLDFCHFHTHNMNMHIMFPEKIPTCPIIHNQKPAFLYNFFLNKIAPNVKSKEN